MKYTGIIAVFLLVFPLFSYADTPIPAIQVLALINGERIAAGIPSVKENVYLDDLAQIKSNDMQTYGYFSHVDSKGKMIWDELDTKSYNYKSLGEILARGFKDAESEQVAWMNSPTHRKVLMDKRYRDVGIGISATGIVTVVFGVVK